MYTRVYTREAVRSNKKKMSKIVIIMLKLIKLILINFMLKLNKQLSLKLYYSNYISIINLITINYV